MALGFILEKNGNSPTKRMDDKNEQQRRLKVHKDYYHRRRMLCVWRYFCITVATPEDETSKRLQRLLVNEAMK